MQIQHQHLLIVISKSELHTKYYSSNQGQAPADFDRNLMEGSINLVNSFAIQMQGKSEYKVLSKTNSYSH